MCNFVGFQALIQYQLRQSAVTARNSLQVCGQFYSQQFTLNWTCLFQKMSVLDLKKFDPWLLLYRDAIFMMVAVSLTFSFQSRIPTFL